MRAKMNLAEDLGRILVSRRETIAVAETTPGGLISASIVAIPGSSAYYDRGIVAYSKAAKIEALAIEAGELERAGAVSEETAKLLSEAIRKVSGTTYGLAETGIAGPVRGRSPKPIGTVHIALAGPGGTEVETLLLEGDRETIQQGISKKAIMFAISRLG